MADIFQNKKERYNINHAIFIIVALAWVGGVAGLSRSTYRTNLMSVGLWNFKQGGS